MALANDGALAAGRDGAGETVLRLAGRDFLADPCGALWCPRTGTLVVSDLHLEKGSAFAARGAMLPPYDTAETLRGLASLIARYGPRRVISLGDSFHDGAAFGRMAARDREALLALQRGRDWIWIAGNHDAAMQGPVPGEHAASLVEDGIGFVHVPSARPEGFEIAGHLHPCVRVALRGRSLRRKAFVLAHDRLVMPAFGAYTGGLNVRDPAVCGLFPAGFSALALGAARLYAIAPALCWPD